MGDEYCFRYYSFFQKWVKNLSLFNRRKVGTRSGDTPILEKICLSFKGNWMESFELTENLKKLGVNNAMYIPNFKKLTVLHPEDLCKEYVSPYRFCIFSRVMKEKGVSDAIDAVNNINKKYGKQIATLDIYGPMRMSIKKNYFHC